MRGRAGTTTILVGLLMALACTENQSPVAVDDAAEPTLIQPAPPLNCGPMVPLAVTLRDDSGDDLFSDGGGAYVEGQNGVEAHINDPTGRLSIWTTLSPRFLNLEYTPSGGGTPVTVPIDRVYTNTHNTSCSLVNIPVGGSGTAVLEAENRSSGGSGSSISKARYGKTCTDGAATLVSITHPDAETWVVSGSTGNYCTLNSRKKWQHAGTVGPFQMTLVK